MDWVKEEDEKPKFNTPVLVWFTCESCRASKPHAHYLFGGDIPKHGPYITEYLEADPGLVEYRRGQGDNSWDHYLENRWATGKKPSHWKYVKSPYKD